MKLLLKMRKGCCKCSWSNFKLMYDELITWGEGDSRYTQRVQGVCPKPLTDTATRKEYVGWLESLRRCSTLHRNSVV